MIKLKSKKRTQNWYELKVYKTLTITNMNTKITLKENKKFIFQWDNYSQNLWECNKKRTELRKKGNNEA